jgi:hypothetical protein
VLAVRHEAVLDVIDQVGPDSFEPVAGIVIQLLFSGRDHRTVLNVVQPEVKEP